MRFLYLAIHYPKPAHRDDLLGAMNHLGRTLRTVPGMLEATAWSDGERVVATSVWASKDAFTAARPTIGAAIAGVPFEAWEARERQLFAVDELAGS